MTADIAASVAARLLNEAKARGEDYERTLTRFAAERVLYRLGASAARERCLLKGASLLAVWLPDPYRVTRDVDLLATGPSHEAAIRELVEQICSVPCPADALVFDMETVKIEAIRAEEAYVGSRVRFRAMLGRARITVQLDIGVGDAVAVAPEEVAYPTLLPSLPGPRILGYPREVAVAEKFEAMVKLDIRNSRMKDFHDIWALAGAFAFEGVALRDAVAACLARRATPVSHELPRVLTSAFYRTPDLEARWRSYLRADAVLIPPPPQFELIGERIRAFLEPVWRSIADVEALKSRWGAGGPWRDTGGDLAQ